MRVNDALAMGTLDGPAQKGQVESDRVEGIQKCCEGGVVGWGESGKP